MAAWPSPNFHLFSQASTLTFPLSTIVSTSQKYFNQLFTFVYFDVNAKFQTLMNEKWLLADLTSKKRQTFSLMRFIQLRGDLSFFASIYRWTN